MLRTIIVGLALAFGVTVGSAHAQDLETRRRMMELAVHESSTHWRLNQFIVGSVRNPQIISSENGVTVVRVEYEYQNDYENPYNPWGVHQYQVGWVEGTFTDWTPDCLRFSDNQYECEPVPKERDLYAWARATWFIADAGMDTFEGGLPGVWDAGERACVRRRTEDVQVAGGATWGTFLYTNTCNREVRLTYRIDDREGGATDQRGFSTVPAQGTLRLQCKQGVGQTVCGLPFF